MEFENQIQRRGTLVEVHIADLHFGAPNIDPKVEYDILQDQFFNRISNLHFDLISINGDLFHKKFQASSDAVRYALMFIARCAELCRKINATLIVLSGTHTHDADQISLLYQFYEDPRLDIRIIETMQFIDVKGTRILCIPEEYGKPYEYYNHFLFDSGVYDEVFMHGTIKGSIYGLNEESLDNPKYPVFSLNSFCNCMGPVIAGHVHVAGCYEKYMYYCSSPIRFQFGEEQPKGFIVLLHNLDTRMHYVHYEIIDSFKFNTVEIDANHLASAKPEDIIAYINTLVENHIDFVRIQFTGISDEDKMIIKSYYKNNNHVSFKDEAAVRKAKLNTTEEVMEKYKGMDFLMDPKLSEMEKFVRYVNYNKGNDYLSVEKLKTILSGGF